MTLLTIHNIRLRRATNDYSPCYERDMLELSWAWETMCSSCFVPFSAIGSSTMAFLMETKLYSRRMASLSKSLGFHWCMAISCVGRSGGLALCWMDTISVWIRSYSQHHIDMEVEGLHGCGCWR